MTAPNSSSSAGVFDDTEPRTLCTPANARNEVRRNAMGILRFRDVEIPLRDGTFQQDIADLRTYPVLTVPVLALGGIYYPLMVAQMEGLATDVRFVELAGAGHYLAEERPDEVVRELTGFFG